jgi:peptidoglycan/xylan/chitin deacetylase (PgdA/CDA1 family)
MVRVRWLPFLFSCLALACGGAPVATSTPTAAAPAPAPVAHRSATSDAVLAIEPVQPASDVAPIADEPTPRVEPPARALEQPLVDPSETRALVLMYHSFDRGSADLTVDGWQLDRQLTWLRENNIEIVTTSELVSFLHGERKLPARVAVVTIDDGDKSVYKVAWPVLRKNKARFTLGLPTKLMQENKKHRMLTWDQVREMVASGLCEVGSHGHEHKSIVHFSDVRAKRELETSRDILERETGQRPEAYFYPLGSFDARTSEIVEKVGYRAAFKATGAPVARNCNSLYSIPRVGIVHRDTVWTLGWYYGPSFLDRMLCLGRK